MTASRRIVTGRIRSGVRRALAGLLRWLPGSSERIGPPRGIIRDFAAWCRGREERLPFLQRGWDQWVWPVREAELVEARPAHMLDQETFSLYRGAQFYWYPQLFLAYVRNARLTGTDGFVVSPDDRVFEEFSSGPGTDPSRWPIFSALRLPPARRMSPTLALIASPANLKPNYFHWMLEILPRIGILEAAGVRQFKLIVPARMEPWQEETLIRLGYPPDQWEPYDGGHWRLESLLVPSLLGFSGMVRPWAVQWLRQKLLLPANGATKRKFYIRRDPTGFRRVENEQEILPILEAAGFEAVSPERLTLEQQIAMFSEASAVASIHGAGLTNIVFAPPGTKVIEFMSPALEYANACYYSLASAAGHEYYYLLGEHHSTKTPPPPGRWRMDLRIDPERLRRLLNLGFRR